MAADSGWVYGSGLFGGLGWVHPRTQDLKALRRMISEADQILQTSPELPQGRTARALELLGDSVTLADYLLTIEPAAVLGKMGGKAPPSAAPSITVISQPSGNGLRAGGRRRNGKDGQFISRS
jgi:hypothetical protein